MYPHHNITRFHSPVIGRFYLIGNAVRLPGDGRTYDGFPVYRASEVADLLTIHPALRALAGCADAETTAAVKTVHAALHPKI